MWNPYSPFSFFSPILGNLLGKRFAMEGCLYFLGYYVFQGGFIVPTCTLPRNDIRPSGTIWNSRRSWTHFEHWWIHDLSLRSRKEKLDLLTKIYYILIIISGVFSISLSKNYAFRLKGFSEHYVLDKWTSKRGIFGQ